MMADRCGRCGAELGGEFRQGIGDVELCVTCWLPAMRALVRGWREVDGQVAAIAPAVQLSPRRRRRKRRRLRGRWRREGR